MVVSAPSPGKCVQNLEPIGVRGGPNVRVSVNYLESVVYRQNLDSRVVNEWGGHFFDGAPVTVCRRRRWL